MSGLRSRVILITGAVSRIGRASALSFARSGAKLALVELRKQTEEVEHTFKKLERISQECMSLGAADVHICHYDISTREGCRSVVEESVERFRGKRGKCQL